MEVGGGVPNEREADIRVSFEVMFELNDGCWTKDLIQKTSLQDRMLEGNKRLRIEEVYLGMHEIDDVSAKNSLFGKTLKHK